MDEELLRTIKLAGFDEKEARIYLALLGLGKGTVWQIAKNSGLKRPIIYVVVEDLVEKGYVSRVPNEKAETYQAIDPSVIFRKLQNNTKIFSEMLPFMENLINKGNERPKLSFYDTKEGILNVYEKLNKYSDQLYFTSYARIEKHFPGIVEEWIKKMKIFKRKIRGRHLIPNDQNDFEFAKEFSKAGQEVRILSNLNNMKMDFAICGNLLVLSSLGEKPFVVAIESEELAESLKPIFEISWKEGKKFI